LVKVKNSDLDAWDRVHDVKGDLISGEDVSGNLAESLATVDERKFHA
jgi:hypothetical protein